MEKFGVMKGEVRRLTNADSTFDNWFRLAKAQGVRGLSKANSDIILRFLEDMKIGINIAVGAKKGGRSGERLCKLKYKCSRIFGLLERRGVKDITKVTVRELHKLFDDMRNGNIKSKEGTAFKSTGDYVKDFKAFWHWYMKIMRKKNKAILDITEDLDRKGEKAKFVYFDENDFENIISHASYDTKPILALAFDSGMRVTELYNVRVCDFSKDFKELTIRDEASKTFGRKIKLMMCADQLREYILKMGFKRDDFIALKSNRMVNKELRKLGKRFLTTDQIKYKNLTLYAFRHSSACFWLPRYKSESALKYRFGWKKSEMIHYYTEFLGMKDTILEDDMYVDVSKTELEKRIKKLEEKIKKNKVISEEYIAEMLAKALENKGIVAR